MSGVTGIDVARGVLLLVALSLFANAVWLFVTANRNLGMTLVLVSAVFVGVWAAFLPRFVRHWWVVAASLLLVAAVAGLASFLAWVGVQDDTTYDEDALIVLGAAVHRDVPSRTLVGRLDEALAYHRRNPSALIVVSGGQGPGEHRTEASVMAEYLGAHGVPAAKIVQEDRSTSTEQNFAFSKKLLDARLPQGYKTVFVTNEFHVYRAGIMAREAGLDPRHVSSSSPWYFWPTYYLRETLAVVKTWVD